jgi:hypothetical protein
MKQFARCCFIVLALCVGMACAVFFFPARWLATSLNTTLADHGALQLPKGHLGKGEALLHIKAIGLSSPIRWQLHFPLQLTIQLCDGLLALTPKQATLLKPMQIPVQHPMAKGFISVESLEVRSDSKNQWRVNGRARAPMLTLDAMGTPIVLRDVALSVDPSGAVIITSAGDIATKLVGRIEALPPVRVELTGHLVPAPEQTAINTLLQRTLTAHPNGGYAVTRRWP